MTATGKPAHGASVKDVARVAGVSLGTVSNVLNRPDRVTVATRGRVEDAMAELGFVRNESARQLRAGHSRVLAFVALDASNPFFTDVASGVEESAADAGLSVFLCNSSQQPSREHAYLMHLQQQRVAGILISPVDPEAAVLEEVARSGTPVVIVDRTRGDDSFCSVAVDDIHGGRIAAEHLIDLGHRRIAYVGGPPHLGQVRERLEGTRIAWRDAGLPPEDLLVLETDALTVAQGRFAGERLAGLPARRRPTAAFCANDLLALGLLQQTIATGRRVPEQLAIVGYDDIEFAEAAAVALTSVRQPRRELGRRAAGLLLAEAEGADGHRHEQVIFTPELVARTSTVG